MQLQGRSPRTDGYLEMFRVPDVPPREFELQILKWVGVPFGLFFLVLFQAWACDLGSDRRACQSECEAQARDFIFVPADGRVGRPAECICR